MADSDQPERKRNPNRGRVVKAFFLDENKNVIGQSSQQLPEDDFRTLYATDLQEPPFDVSQLVFLAEQQPIHNAALEQKAADVIGMGWEWEDEKDNSAETQRDQLEEWFKSLNDERTDETILEILGAAWNDLETVGQGLIEVARDPSGKVQYLYPMPAHTCRFARDGVRVCQIRQGKRRWFKRWVPEDDRVVTLMQGNIYETAKQAPKGADIGNEVLVLKRPARRSSWYGIPTYVAALGWIVLSVLARDDNIYWFENRREPRWAIILTNLDDDPNLEEDLKQALQTDLKEPHRNLVIPIEGPGKIEFKQLSDLKTGDMSFERLQERSGSYILVGHKMPPDRLGLTKVGPLGGNAAIDTTRVYKEGVIQTAQMMLSARINRFIRAEGPIKTPSWTWKPIELDLTEEKDDLAYGTEAFQAGLIRLNEGRRKIGEPELDDKDPRGDMFINELAAQAQSLGAGEGPPPGGGDEGPPPGGGDETQPNDEQPDEEQEPPTDEGGAGQ